MSQKNYRHVNYLWDDAVAATLDPVDLLVYRSNLLGADQRITNTGGGNTSSKVLEKDPLTGEEVEVLWVKGSGGDLRTSKRANFSSLYQEKVIGLEAIYNAAPEKGPKTAIEDAMVGMYTHCTFNLNPRASSIDTPLHAFIPHKHVDHMHPNAVIALAAADNGPEITREIYGDTVIWLDWQRPGFDLGLQLKKVCTENPHAVGVMLGQHGIINWADDPKACYELTLDLIEKAAEYIEVRDQGEKTFGGSKYAALDDAARDALLAQLLPWLRGKVSEEQRFIGTIQTDPVIQRFVNSHDAPRLADLGTSCPDHFLRTKIKPLYVAWDPASGDLASLKAALELGLAQYKVDYQAYYDRCVQPGSPAIRNAIPTVILIPGVGMIAWGKSKSESRVTAEFYNCAVEVIRGAEVIGNYRALPEQEAFDIEYWLLEEAKLRRMPPEKALDRRIVAVVGAGSGIGKAAALRVMEEGAHVVCIDLNEEAAAETAKEITAIYGEGIGVAGSGISGCGPAIGVSCNATDRVSVEAALSRATLAYGGLDSVVCTVGYIYPSDATGHIPDDRFSLTFDINVKAAYIVSDQAYNQIFKPQGLKSTCIITTSANALVVKKGTIAYDTSKAASNHLVRELAFEQAPIVRVNGVAPATVVKGSQLFPRDRVIYSLERYKIPFTQDEETDSLKGKLADFYAQRTLTKEPITPEDQAEAIYLLVSDALSKTTGQILAVDGGLHEAFLR